MEDVGRNGRDGLRFNPFGKMKKAENKNWPPRLKNSMSRFNQKQTDSLAKLVFLITSVMGAIACVSPYTEGRASNFRLFSFHPLLLLSSLGCFVTAALYKKVGGLQNTRFHGNLSFFGVCLMAGGVYAIYLNKENNGKPHFKTTHGFYALNLAGVLFGLLLNGLFALHPDYGWLKKNQSLRKIHHWTGKGMLLGMCYLCWDGVNKMMSGSWVIVVFGVPLVVLGLLGLA